MASLIVWMNGERVGEWGTVRGGTTPFFRYDEAWAKSDHGRSLSLSIPLTADLEVRGPHVANYFDNLLPDNPEIRNRIRSRFGTASSQAFDLLTAIGRDCVGAVQLLPPNEEPVGWNRIEAEPLNEERVEDILRSVTSNTLLAREEQEEFRISLAGAQEKTALLGMSGNWFRPQHATPTTHILKLPLGIVGGFRGNLSNTVENEWLCARLLSRLGLHIAETDVAHFGEQVALVVTRFDRRWVGVGDGIDVQARGFKLKKGMWIARLPQEDLCQATGRPPTRKYESEGGPSIRESLDLLAGSEDAINDQSDFVLAQLAFWLLAATDGHGKNFSLTQLAGGAFRMTPLYDVISAWPIIGHGKSQLAIEKAKLAMAVRGKNAHYRIDEITARQWRALAEETGIRGFWDRMQSFVDAAAVAIDQIARQLPKNFPPKVYDAIRHGVHTQVTKFKNARPQK